MSQWKDLPGYEEYYEISDSGDVRNKKTGRLRSPFKDSGGYMRLTICRKKIGVNASIGIGRKVAEAFIPNPNNLPEVNHIDEDKTNNHVSNLEWCTRSYNANYGTGAKRSGLTRSVPVVQLTLKGEFVREWQSAREVERETGWSNSNINSCINKKAKTAYGFKWVKKDEYEASRRDQVKFT